MTEAKTQFDVESGLFWLNLIDGFPEGMREKVVIALEKIVSIIPGSGELARARDCGGREEMEIEIKYGEAADVFARTIDPSFNSSEGLKTASGNSENTLRLRGEFYQMIRPLSPRNIADGLKAIGHEIQIF